MHGMHLSLATGCLHHHFSSYDDAAAGQGDENDDAASATQAPDHAEGAAEAADSGEADNDNEGEEEEAEEAQEGDELREEQFADIAQRILLMPPRTAISIERPYANWLGPLSYTIWGRYARICGWASELNETDRIHEQALPSFNENQERGALLLGCSV
jgi:hypothetical protein